MTLLTVRLSDALSWLIAVGPSWGQTVVESMMIPRLSSADRRSIMTVVMSEPTLPVISGAGCGGLPLAAKPETCRASIWIVPLPLPRSSSEASGSERLPPTVITAGSPWGALCPTGSLASNTELCMVANGIGLSPLRLLSRGLLLGGLRALLQCPILASAGNVGALLLAGHGAVLGLPLRIHLMLADAEALLRPGL